MRTVGDEAKVLFLCTGNSARSQMAEAIVNLMVTVCDDAAENCPLWL